MNIFHLKTIYIESGLIAGFIENGKSALLHGFFGIPDYLGYPKTQESEGFQEDLTLALKRENPVNSLKSLQGLAQQTFLSLTACLFFW